LAHNSVTAGHPGAKRIYHNIRAIFYWPSMARDCYTHVAACSLCARKRLRVKTKRKPLTLFLPQQPFEMVSIDLLGPLQTTDRQNTYALVITDRFSKLSRAVPVPSDTSAPTIATAYFVHWVSNYGAPLVLFSDNGPPFRAKLFKSFNFVLGTHTVFTTAYRPQTNGQVERWNKTLLDSVRAFCQEHAKDWDLMLAHASLAYNQTVHSSTGMAPAELIVPAARHRPLLSNLLDSFDLPTHFTSPLAYRQAVLHLAEKNGRAARDTNQKQAERCKAAYYRRVKPMDPIEQGDFVFFRSVSTNKLLLPFTGPHLVEKKGGRSQLSELLVGQ
jgi:Integrase zinc binding domain